MGRITLNDILHFGLKIHILIYSSLFDVTTTSHILATDITKTKDISTVFFVAEKAKVVPHKMFTGPRLEPSTALILYQQTHYMKNI